MTQSLKGKTVLITAGPTREYLDPVRYLSNESSGRMGYALAQEATKMGAHVILVSGPTHLKKPKVKKFISVVSAQEMYTAVLKVYRQADVIIAASAVADLRPLKIQRHKIKKCETENANGRMPLELTKNPDILKKLGQVKRKDQLLIGFALETRDLLKNALRKMREKNCDMMIANLNLSIGNQPMHGLLIQKNGKKIEPIRESKEHLALRILKSLERLEGLR